MKKGVNKLMARPKGMDQQTVQRIREIYSSGCYTQTELAGIFNISQSTICKIINNYIHRMSGIKLGGEAGIRLGLRYGDSR